MNFAPFICAIDNLIICYSIRLIYAHQRVKKDSQLFAFNIN